MRGFVVIAALLLTAPAAAQPAIDAGVDAGQTADAGPIADGGVPADAGEIQDPELLRHEVAERDLAVEAQEAAREEQEAAEATARAIEEQARAESEAELLLTTERARLEEIRKKQASYNRRVVLAGKSALAARARAHRELVTEIREALAGQEVAAGVPAALYDRVRTAMETALASGIGTVSDIAGGVSQPPRPAVLPESVLVLEPQRPVDVAELRALRIKLSERADELLAAAEELVEKRIELDYQVSSELTPLRERLLRRMIPRNRDHRLGLRGELLGATRDEVVQLSLHVAYWVHVRGHQLHAQLTSARDWVAIGGLVWSFIELVILLILLRFALGRWDRWMTSLIASVGRSMHLGSGALLVARTAELARSFGPALLVTGAAVAAYLRLRGSGPEVEVGFIVVFWLGVFRTQLRFVEGLSRYVGTRRAEQRAAARELEQEIVGDDEAPAEREPAPEEPKDLEPTWQTLARTWRLGTRYVASLFIVLQLVDFAVGRAATHHLLWLAAWWGALPLAGWLLYIWRPRVVYEYLRRTPSREGVLARLAEKHAHRFYGPLIVAPALVVVLVRRTIRFARTNLSDLDATKRLLAWLFRRRVEKHAQEHGRVLDRPHELPADLLEQFPRGPIGPEQKPIKPPCLAQIKKLFDEWCVDRAEGSVAIVGATGMGKTTVLKLLEDELGEPVMRAKLITKVTSTEQLVRRLARLLELDGEPTTEAEMISLLHDEKRRIIAVDNCHHLFLRQVGGFEAWEAFTRLVNETSDSVFWIATFNDVAWDYLNNISSRLSYFRTIVRLSGWSDVEIRRLILSRMRRARYRTSFTDLLVTKLEGVSMSSQIIGTSHGYFRLLWDFTNGNPRDAVYFWLRSLVPIEGERRARVHLFASPQIDELQKLPNDIVFVLQAIVEHENLSADELYEVTNMPPEFCRFALRYCRETGYLVRNPGTGRSQLSVHWHQTVIRFLKRQHLIYS